MPWNARRHAHDLKVSVFNSETAPVRAEEAADVLRALPFVTEVEAHHGEPDKINGLRPHATGYVAWP